MRLFILTLFFPIVFNAQIDSALTVPLIGINFGGQFPSGDMVRRFGPNLRAGGSFLIKTKKNWVYGIESHYLFGKNVKEDVLLQLRTSEGFVIDNEGFPADIRVTQRGINVHAVVGRVFNFMSANPNSGLMVNIGAGYMQHKINLYDAQQKIAAVRGDLKKGYDRLTGGFSTCIFAGYLFLSENRLLNFYFGVESYQGYTQSLRKVNYDTGLPDVKQRLDILTGVRAGWILPLYKRRPNDVYYY